MSLACLEALLFGYGIYYRSAYNNTVLLIRNLLIIVNSELIIGEI